MGSSVFDSEVDAARSGSKFSEVSIKSTAGLVVHIGACGWSEGTSDFAVRTASNGGDGGRHRSADLLDSDHPHLYEIFFGFVANSG